MQEQDILKNIVVPCELNPLPVREVEIDEFDVRYTANEKMNIQNDTITLNYRLSGEVSPSASMQRTIVIMQTLDAINHQGLCPVRSLGSMSPDQLQWIWSESGCCSYMGLTA